MRHDIYNRKLPDMSPSLTGRVGVGLLLLLFLLSSCKQSRSVEAQTDAVSVSKLQMADSIRTDIRFQFDEFNYWHIDSVEFDSVNRPKLKGVKHGVIHQGEMKNERTETKLKQTSDSLTLRSQEVIHPVNVPPKLPKSIALAIIFFIVFIIIASRTHE